MELVMSVPYLVRIILSLFAILVFQKVLKRLDLAMVTGIVILALWTGQTPATAAAIAKGRLFSFDTFFLVVIVAGVIWLSGLMSEAGIMKDLVVCLKSRLSRRAILAALPAVVGLLPMPAGALFSAPLVDDADDAGLLSQVEKTRINYWFRHVWEYWWPLYPGVLLAVDLSKLPIFFFVLLLSPMFLAAVAAGYLFLLRKVPNSPPKAKGPDDKSFLPLVLPTLTVIGVYGILLAAVPALARVDKYLPMVIGVAAGLAVLQIQRPLAWKVWKKQMFSKRVLGLLVIIVLARIYGAFIEARLTDGDLLMDHLRAELNTFGIPAIILVIVIPFVSGLTTGITVGYIGASFPVVLSLAGPTPGEFYSTIVLGFASGFIGMMLSPIHVCLIVTNEYFKTSLTSSLAGMIRPAALTLFFAVCYGTLLYTTT